MRYIKVIIVLCFMTFFFFNESKAKQIKKLLVIGAPEAKPYASENLPNGGFYPELIREIFHRTYNIEINYLPFKRIIGMLKLGTLAGSAIVSYKEDRARFLYYPKNELYCDKLVVYGLRNGKTLENFTGLASLRGSVIGTFRGGFIEKELAVIDVAYESVNTNEQNIKKLLLGRVDFIISPEMILRYLLKNYFSANEWIRIIGYDPPYKLDKHYVAFSKAFPSALEISKEFDRGLALIKKDGRFDKIKAKYNFSEK